MKKKICIIGHARHGKDTLAEMINQRYGYKSESSSQAASRLFLYDALKDKYGYKTPEECFEDRVNHRAEWFDMICEYNKNYPGQLAADIMKSNDIYTGMRSNRELVACIDDGIFDLVIGVFDPMKPLEPRDSFHRFTVKANEYYQSYFVEPPTNDGKCEMYWGENAQFIWDTLKDICNGK